MSVAAALLMRQKIILDGIEKCGAFSEESAVTLRQAGIFNPNDVFGVAERLVKKNILKQTSDGKYYLNKST
ncbi:MAG: hypothetical protein NC253_13535 [Ruminococcus sp.]|nr:hypothetical protein [Ruminococcus sp.]MCM1480658.1 hypothetical protein [Muribaculaceae bacterium]